MNGIAQTIYFSLGAYMLKYDLQTGLLMSLLGGMITGAIVGYFLSCYSQTRVQTLIEKYHQRLLIEFFIQIAGVASIPFAFAIFHRESVWDLLEMMSVGIIGHFIFLTCKATILLIGLQFFSFEAYESTYHELCFLTYHMSMHSAQRRHLSIVPMLELSVMPTILEELEVISDNESQSTHH